MDVKELGSRIQGLRKSMKLSQEVLSARSGVARRALQLIEKGQANPTIQTIQALSDVLKVDLFQPSTPAALPTPFGAAAEFLSKFSGLPEDAQRFVIAFVYKDPDLFEKMPEGLFPRIQSASKAKQAKA